MRSNTIQRIAIVGGGTAGWMAAAYLNRALAHLGVAIDIIDPVGIASVGVGEATIPLIKSFNKYLGLNEAELLYATQGTYKLGIHFQGWQCPNKDFFHAFGDFGEPIAGLSPHHFFLKLQQSGLPCYHQDFSFPSVAALDHKFAPPPNQENLRAVASYQYAYHLDALAYASFLKKRCLQQGVNLIENKLHRVVLDQHSGNIDYLELDNQKRVQADFYMDCTGFKRLLMGALGSGLVDWSQHLPCDRAIALPSEADRALRPYTTAKALSSGWSWHIPLQHRMGNGYVYSSAHIADEDAEAELRSALLTAPKGDAKIIQFETGHLEKFWRGNCLALGLAAGFLEPLESTSIHLIQSALARFVDHLPVRANLGVNSGEFNRLTKIEYERIRDFIVLHYFKSGRRESEFWRQVSSLAPPDALAYKIEVYQQTAKVVLLEGESFLEPSWLSLYFGLNVQAQSYKLLADSYPLDKIQQTLAARRADIKKLVGLMPHQKEVLNKTLAGLK